MKKLLVVVVESLVQLFVLLFSSLPWLVCLKGIESLTLVIKLLLSGNLLHVLTFNVFVCASNALLAKVAGVDNDGELRLGSRAEEEEEEDEEEVEEGQNPGDVA